MSNFITNEAALKDKFRIEDIIRHYEENWNGKSKIKCPFHNEKTASFSVSASKNIATCFGGCGSFDPIAYVMEKEACTYPEALELCAKICGLTVEYDTKSSPQMIAKRAAKQEKRGSMLQLNKIVAGLYFNEAYGEKMPDTIEFKNDNQVRSLSKTTVEKFRVCQTPEDWDFLLQRKLDEKLLEELGIIAKSQQGRLYEVFRNKQLFPIQGKNNEIVGFAGRKLKKEEKCPKYTNSKESIIYRKRDLLYGLYPQANLIRKQGICYMGEGYWDVLTPYDLGFKGIVANCGTALTKDQAQLIGRFAKRVCILADNDSNKETNSGLKAVQRNLPILLEQQLFVEVVVFPDGHDPDSFIREVGLKKFESYIKEERQDALIWYVDYVFESSDKDNFVKVEIVKTILEFLVLINNVTMVDAYSNQICELLDLRKSSFALQLREAQNKHISARNNTSDGPDLNEEQMRSRNMYQLYEKANRIFCTREASTDVEISNFIVRPLFHLDSRDDPKRLFEVVNRLGHRKIIDTETANLVSLDRFRNTVEAQGNFVFLGNQIQYSRLKRKMYDLMQTAYEINTLGHHNDGFYVFGNGIYTSKNEFLEPNEYGIVQHSSKQYFLPALSSIYKTERNLYKEEKNAVYNKTSVDFKEWSKLFIEVHGKKGMIGMGFYFASLFRSYIQNYVKLPLLNLFGMPQTGKSLLAENLICMFGKEPLGFNIHSGTKVSLYNKFIVMRDGLILFEEYKNFIHPDKIEALKSVYDGIGRERGQKKGSKNITTPIYSTAIVVGQELPTADVALFTRCISMSFSKTGYSQEEKDKADQLKALRGQLTSITAEISSLRNVVQDHFTEYYRTCFTDLRKVCQEGGYEVSSRMIENNAILIAVHKCLEEHLEMPFSNHDLFTACADNLFHQHTQMSKENEVSQFWSLVEFMAASKLIGSDDYCIRYGKKEFSNARLLYINFSKSYPLYMTHHKQQYNKQGLTKASLLHYLEAHHAFIEKKSGFRFGKKNTSAYVFNYEALEKIGVNIGEAPDPPVSNEEWEEAKKQVAKVAPKATNNSSSKTSA